MLFGDENVKRDALLYDGEEEMYVGNEDEKHLQKLVSHLTCSCRLLD